MKKFRGFTLLESLAVIGIIGIISTAIFNMRNIGNDYNDYRKEAANVIYKEINQSLKDFQRNKTWNDPQGNIHEISSFQIKFGTKDDLLRGVNGNYGTVGQSLEIGTTYLYCLRNKGNNDFEIVDCFSGDDISNVVNLGTGFFDSTTLIKNTQYTSSKKIKNIDKFDFLLDGGYDIDAINILSYGSITNGDYIEKFANDVDKARNESAEPNSQPLPTQDELPESCRTTYSQCYDLYSGGNKRQPCFPSSIDHKCCYGYITILGITIRPDNCNMAESCEKCMDQTDYDKLNQKQMEKCLKNYYIRNCDEVLAQNNETIDPSVLAGPESNTTSYSFIIYAAEKNGAKNCTVNLELKNNNNGNSTQDLLNENEKETKNALVKFCLSDNFDDYFKQDIDHKVDQKQVKIADENFIKIDVNATERLKIMKGLDFFINIRDEFLYLREKEQDSKEARDICKGISERLNNRDPLSSSDKQKFLECCKGIVVINEEIEKKYSEGKGNETQPTTTNKTGKEWRPVGKITINTITKTASLERCKNDRESNGIDCGNPYCYQ